MSEQKNVNSFSVLRNIWMLSRIVCRNKKLFMSIVQCKHIVIVQRINNIPKN